MFFHDLSFTTLWFYKKTEAIGIPQGHLEPDDSENHGAKDLVHNIVKYRRGYVSNECNKLI